MRPIEGRMKLFLLGALLALAVTVVVGFAVLSSGLMSASALSDAGAFEGLLAYASRRSIANHAKDEANPFAGDKEALAMGIEHFKANCLLCHGAPGLETSQFAKGLNPPPPDLTSAPIQEFSDGELFWIVSNGIRMTGMPAFSPTHGGEEIWHIVAFVRHLSQLTDDEKALLAEGASDEAGHQAGKGAAGAESSHSGMGHGAKGDKKEGMATHGAGQDGQSEPDENAGASADKRSDKPAQTAAATPGQTTELDLVQLQKPSYPLKTCVISGEELGAKGDPIEIVVEGRLVRLCCQDCRKDLNKDPAQAFKKIDAAVIEAQRPGYPMSSDPVTGEELGEKAVDYVHGTRLVRLANGDSIALFLKDPKASMAQVDKALIDAQLPSYPLKTCVVSRETLGGEMGEPIDYLHGTRLIRFCCKECPSQFEEDPASYLLKLDRAARGEGK